MLFHFSTLLAEVPFAHERPMQRAHDPVLQALHISSHVPVEFRASKGRDALLIFHERVDRHPAHLAHVVDGLLEVHPVIRLQDRDHVMRVTNGLFLVI